MSELALKEAFPHEEVWSGQEEALKVISENPRVVFEQPQGAGKTADGYSMLQALRKKNGRRGAYLYVAPNKTIINQVRNLYPEVRIVYGKNEYSCPYYEEQGEDVQADEAPCSLIDCPHRAAIGQQTPRVEPCPYYQARAQIEQGEIVACTTAFFLINRVYHNWPLTAGVVLDEIHRVANSARLLFGYNITDYNLKRLIDFLEEINSGQADNLRSFLDTMKEIARGYAIEGNQPTDFLKPHEIRELRDKLEEVSLEEVRARVTDRVQSGALDPVELREDLNKLEDLSRNIGRYINSFEYALEDENRHPLAYVCAFFQRNLGKYEKVKYRLCIENHYVAGLIRMALEGIDRVVGFSATIGDSENFEIETGIDYPVRRPASNFSADNARIYRPSDVPNLAVSSRSSMDLVRNLKKIGKAVKTLNNERIRCLVVVISESERHQFLEIAQEMNLDTVSYGERRDAKQAKTDFKKGEGDLLVGTSANYAHGIDLPGETCMATFLLRLNYPNPRSASGKFEKDKVFKGEVWKIWNYRAITEARQVRGRNIRSEDDTGVTFFVSQQFSRYFPGAFPDWLQSSWREGKTMEQQVEQAIDFLP